MDSLPECPPPPADNRRAEFAALHGAPLPPPAPTPAGREPLAEDELLLLREAARLLGMSRNPGRIVLEMAHLLDATAPIEAGPVLPRQSTPCPGAPAPALRVYQRVDESDRPRLQLALSHAGGIKSRAAQLLGLTLRQFNYRCKVLGLPH
jgi:transcriptional regulator with GAF, ATPase, and Fis domain